jgi:uncharacterized phage infection (PIP) family protein YhgE
MNKKTDQTAIGNNITQVINNLDKLNSTISILLPEISNLINAEESPLNNDFQSFDIEKKLVYNKLDSFGRVIDEYLHFCTAIDSLYKVFDDKEPGFKKKILRYFTSKYLIQKLKHINDIKSNSDLLIADIIQIVSNDVKKSKNIKLNLEEIDPGVMALIVHAFINCKILEKPPQ